MKVELPMAEKDRLAVLESLHLLDTPVEPLFDNLTFMAAKICQTPIALVTLVDRERQWFKSAHGLPLKQTPREHSFCAHAIRQPLLFTVEDASKDSRFRDNPYVVEEPRIRFYAGYPLVAGGYAVGTLCVIDREPRRLSREQIESLQTLAEMAAAEIEGRLMRTEEQLREAEDKYRTLVESTTDLVQIIDGSGNLLFANRAWRETLGYETGDISALNMAHVLSPGCLAQCRGFLADLRAGKKLESVRADFLARDGRLIPVEGNVSGRYRAGTLAAVYCFFRDIGPRLRAERERQAMLEKAEAARAEVEHAHKKLQETLERITDGFVSLDSKWRYSYVNQRAAEMFGRERSELAGKHIWSEFPDGVGQPFHKAYEKALATQQTITLQDYYPPWDRWFENRIYPDRDGVSIFFQDITERVRAETNLKESEARLRLATEAANVGLWDWNLAANTVYFSPGYKRQLGYREEELSNRFDEWKNRVHPDDIEGVMDRVRAYLDNPEGRHEAEFRMRHKDGSYRWILTHAAVLRDADGRPVRMLGSHIDITEAKRLDDQMRHFARESLHAQELERRKIARELHDSTGQTLVALKIALVQLRTVADNSVRAVLEDALHLLDESIREVRTISYLLHPPLLDELGLEGGLRAMIEGFSRRSGIAVDLVVSGEIGIPESETQIVVFRVVQESLANILRHSGSPRASVRIWRDDETLEVAVQDEGSGMTDALQRSEMALGVGIMGMKERVRLLGGRLVISSADRGTTVSVSLPLQARR